MRLHADPDVQAVAEFMQRNIPAARLVGVATGLGMIAPALWGQHDPSPVIPLTLQPTIMSGCLHGSQSTSIGSADDRSAGGDSAGGMCCRT